MLKRFAIFIILGLTCTFGTLAMGGNLIAGAASQSTETESAQHALANELQRKMDRAARAARAQSYRTAHAQKSGTVTVTVTGFGENDAKAREDGWKKAVSQVVGTYVSAEETLVNETLKSEILTLSFGYVTKSEEISRQTDDSGFVSLEMEVTVSKSKIDETIRTGSFTMIDIGQVPLDRRRVVAEQLLLKAFSDYPKKIIKASLTGKNTVFHTGDQQNITINDIIKVNKDELFLQFMVTISVDQEKYLEFIRQITPLLDVIEEFYVKENNIQQRLERFSVTSSEQKIPLDKFSFIRGGRNLTYANSNIDGFYVCTNMNDAITQTRWKLYHPGKDLILKIKRLSRIKVEFLDNENNIVVEKFVPFHLYNGNVGFSYVNFDFDTYDIDYRENRYKESLLSYPLISPMFFTPTPSYKSRDRTSGLSFTYYLADVYSVNEAVFQDEVDEIKSVRITVE